MKPKLSLALILCLAVLINACTSQPTPAAPTTSAGDIFTQVAATLTAAATSSNSADAATQVANLVAQNLAAAAPTATQAAPAAQPADSSGLVTTYTNAVSVPLQIVLGIWKLDGTDQALSKDQANQLLPLWNTYLGLLPGAGNASQGDTNGQGNAAPSSQSGVQPDQTKIEAAIQQLEKVLTAQQIQSIAGFQITQETAQTIMKDKGISQSGPAGAGQPPQGNGSSKGNAQPPQDTSLAGTPDATQGNAGAGPAGGNGFIPTELSQAFIQYLQKAAGISASGK